MLVVGYIHPGDNTLLKPQYFLRIIKLIQLPHNNMILEEQRLEYCVFGPQMKTTIILYDETKQYEAL